MSLLLKIAVVIYIVGLSLALVVGSWPLEGPIVAAGPYNHGIHAGDLGVLAATAIACAVVLRSP